MPPSTADVMALCATTAFGKPIIVNNLRGLVAEAVLRLALPDEWTWCSGDWAGHDFEHQDGTKLEVKQSAVRQSWKPGPKGYGKPVFDIAERKGRYEGSVWVDGAGRHADIYVFALHAVTDDTADQRDPSQWQFAVVPASLLPAARTISLARVKALGQFVGFVGIAREVEAVRAAVR